MTHPDNDTGDVLIIESTAGSAKDAALGTGELRGALGWAWLPPTRLGRDWVWVNDEEPTLLSVSRRVVGLSTAGKDLALLEA